MLPVTIIWHDNGFSAPRPKALELGRRVMSLIYVGDKGTLMDGLLIPEPKRKACGRAPKTLPRSPGQYQEFYTQVSHPELIRCGYNRKLEN